MTTEKKLLMLDIACDIISSIHTDLCAGTEDERALGDATMHTLKSCFRLSDKLEKLKKREKKADCGKWIYKNRHNNITYCSLCDYFYKNKPDEPFYHPFCPNCGKPMLGGEEE